LQYKEEYSNLAKNLDEDSMSRIQFYQNEIVKLQKEVDQISESLTQSDKNDQKP
jgi:hypothetical protein